MRVKINMIFLKNISPKNSSQNPEKSGGNLGPEEPKSRNSKIFFWPTRVGKFSISENRQQTFAFHSGPWGAVGACEEVRFRLRGPCAFLWPEPARPDPKNGPKWPFFGHPPNTKCFAFAPCSSAGTSDALRESLSSPKRVPHLHLRIG